MVKNEKYSIIHIRMILVLFGSFNPITLGHLHCLTVAKNTLDSNHIRGLLVPMTENYPYKKLLSDEHRLNMCRLATEKYPWIETKIFINEIFSRKIIDKIQTLYPNESLKYLCGTDKIQEFEHWSNQEDVTYIGEHYGFIFVHRENYPYDTNILDKYKITEFCQFIDQPVNVSSTEIKNKLLTNESVDNLINEKVLIYFKNVMDLID